MKRFTARLALVPLTLLALASTAAHAQSFRAYVASYGSDSNPCTVGAPCRLLPAALNAIVSGGEVWMLDSANFNTGTLVLTKSANILAVPGQVGSIVAVASAPAIQMDTPGITVTLRNVVVTDNAANRGTDGIVISSGVLNIEDSLLSNFVGAGIRASGSSTRVNIKGTVLRNILTTDYAIVASNGPGINVNNSQLLNTAGIHAIGDSAVLSTTTVVLSDSQISGGGYAGLYADVYAANATVKMFCERSSIQGVGYALDAETSGSGSAMVAAAYCTVSNNSRAIYQVGTGSIVKSYGNNHIGDNNGATDVGTLTTATLR